MGRVVVISGPIGAGKTAVARHLAAQWEGPLISIEGDDFWRFLLRPKPEARLENFRLVMAAQAAAAIPFARAGYDVLLDFSIPPGWVKMIQKILKEIPLDFVLLRPAHAVCVQRASTRQEGRITAYDAEFYAAFAGMDDHAIEADAADVASLAAHIRQALKDGLYRVPPA